jgi:hypothetical protein
MMGPIKKAPLTIGPAGILNHMTYLIIVIKLLNFKKNETKTRGEKVLKIALIMICKLHLVSLLGFDE